VISRPQGLKILKLDSELGEFGSFCLYIGSLTMHVQKEGISKVWVPNHQEANSPQGS
jgi:hypothetical protein